MKQLGNIKSNQIYIPNGARNPPPTDLEESERDSQLEKYIRTKYESKRFMDSHRKHDSNSSGSNSVSSAISFIMSSSPTPSPASSIFHQSPRNQLSMSARSPCGVTAFPERRQIANPRTVTSGSAQATAQFQPVSQDTSSIHHHNSQVPQPPLRPATAPIPSDGYSSSQCAPPVPPVPSHYGTNTFQGNMFKNPDGTFVNQSAVHHPTLNIHHEGNQAFHRVIQHNPVPPPRTDGVWGDLMQLTEPSLNPSQPAPSTGIFGSNANPVNTSTYRPLSSTDPTQMNGLEADMGRLTYGSQMNAPPNQHQLSRNPFFTNSYQSSGFQQTLHGPSAHHLPPSNPTMLSHNHQPHPIPNQHPPFSNPNPVPNRNPFLTNNQQSFQPNPDGFTTYYQPSHPQSSTPLSINQHSPFHR
ncbi:hypothetical protein Pst134EA_013654 [Puccinia striiformis f. sp. tritici]|uniref:hypothetical protein n=2 Tax=Puccinia striiformis f. sp. tritici TaxID=168172 RepID=UPI002007F42C|nr:hypothetical protein Pst134EA_013654 [Puccinia striiformis f. sp. tritici]KAH9465790.1 hypothetical protein Pst134EA_013654 [Puccinia striiformis f. sp. tritici]